MLVGNKCDLKSGRKISSQQLKERGAKWRCPVFETSAKEKIHITDAFYEVVREIRKKEKQINQQMIQEMVVMVKDFVFYCKFSIFNKLCIFFVLSIYVIIIKNNIRLFNCFFLIYI